MRRTEDISFDYNKNKNTDVVQKNKYHKKESFVINVKEIKKKEQKQKVERPATVKVAKGPWEIVYSHWR